MEGQHENKYFCPPVRETKLQIRYISQFKEPSAPILSHKTKQK